MINFDPKTFDMDKLMKCTLKEVISLLETGGFKIKVNLDTENNLIETTITQKQTKDYT